MLSGSRAQGRTMSQTLRVTVVIALYLLLNSSLNMLNKWALASFFPFPLLLTTVHMMFSFVVRSGALAALLPPLRSVFMHHWTCRVLGGTVWHKLHSMTTAA